MHVYLLLAALLTTAHALSTQSTSVKGRLLCGTSPAVGVEIKLFDKDTGFGPNPDDQLDKVLTDADGYFKLSGSSIELTDIDPEIRIYHDCRDIGQQCLREWVFKIPSKYVTNGETSEQIMDFGTMNLEVEIDNEKRSCQEV